jgi:hypothetical protein
MIPGCESQEGAAATAQYLSFNSFETKCTRLQGGKIVKKFVLAAMTCSAAAWLATTASAASFSFSTGNADGRLGALSQPASASELETETADDFILNQTTVIKGATISGLLTLGATPANIGNVEVEVYHVFNADSVDPPSGNVPTRANSPADVEIDSATRDGSSGTLSYFTSLVNSNFSVANTVVRGINKKPGQTTKGEGEANGEEVEITVTFTPPIVLPASPLPLNHYFFRPEVLVTGGNFLYLSAPRPIVSPGTPFTGDLQAWIRNSDLAPDWLRIGTDIVGGATPPTFNMTFSLSGETVPVTGTPGRRNCHGKTIAALAHQFGSVDAAAGALGFGSVTELQDAFVGFCKQ